MAGGRALCALAGLLVAGAVLLSVEFQAVEDRAQAKAAKAPPTERPRPTPPAPPPRSGKRAGEVLPLLDAVKMVAWKDLEMVPVWVWWDFPQGVPAAYRLNVRTWLRHIPAEKFELRLVNRSTILRYLPELPDEFFRLYPLAQSDYLRAAMLALHGGVYMDGDMMLRDDLDKVFGDLFDDTVDVVPYLWESQECRKSFSTNFLAGAKGNPFSVQWLRKILVEMNTTCPPHLEKSRDNGMYEFYNSLGCCKLQSGEARRECYVSFGEFGDKSAHAAIVDLDRSANADSRARPVRMRCISKWLGMAANASGSGGELLWKRLLPGPPAGYRGPIGPWGKVPKREQQAEMCWRDGPRDLRCTQSGLYPYFFERHGYHLFNSMNRDLLAGWKREEDILDSDSVIATLYRLALEGERGDVDPRLRDIHLEPMAVTDWELAKQKMWGDTRQYKMPWLRGRD